MIGKRRTLEEEQQVTKVSENLLTRSDYVDCEKCRLKCSTWRMTQSGLSQVSNVTPKVEMSSVVEVATEHLKTIIAATQAKSTMH